MTRDEVIWSLERCTCGVPDACRDCKVYDMREAADGDCIVCMEELMREALAMLKTEPKRGRWIEETDRERHWHCSWCGYVAGIAARTFKYCPECGSMNTEE